jgi:hypothetical protein
MIGLDLFPEETGVIIRKVDTQQVVFIRQPGDFVGRREEVAYEEISVAPGVYEVEILDQWGDGIAAFQDDSNFGFYLVAMSSELEKDQYTPIIYGCGDSFEDRSKTKFIVEGETAKFPLSVSFITEKPLEFGYRLFRLDFSDGDILVADSPFGWYYDESSKEIATVNVVEGGLYKLQLLDSGDGRIEATLLLGSTNPDQARIVSLDSFNHLEEIKVIAETEPRNVATTDRLLSLRMLLENTPEDISWIIITDGSGSSVENEPTLEIQRTATSRQTVAFGPQLLHGKHLAGKEFVETITIPQVWGAQSFNLLISDSEGDGGRSMHRSAFPLGALVTVAYVSCYNSLYFIFLPVCCKSGTGGVIELFDGSAADGILLLSTSFDSAPHLVESFQLEGTPQVCCCAFGEPCDIQCDQQDVDVSGCIFDKIDGVVDVDETGPSTAPSSEAASSGSRKKPSARLILSALVLLLLPFEPI